MKCTNHNNRFIKSNYLRIVRRSLNEVIKLQPLDTFIMIFISVLFVIINRFGIIMNMFLFSKLQVLPKNMGFLYSLRAISLPLVFYTLYLLLIGIKKVMFNRYYIQYNALSNFEKKSKVKIQKKCSNIELMEYEKPELHEKIYEAHVSSINIFRIVESVITQFGLITNFFVIGAYFLKLDYLYVVLIFISTFPAIAENIFKVKEATKSRKILNKLERQENEIFEIMISPKAALENKILNCHNFLMDKLGLLQIEHEELLSKINRKYFRIETLSSFIMFLGNSAAIGIAIFFLMNNKDFGQFVATIMAFRILSDNIKELVTLQGYLNMFSKMVGPYFEFMDIRDLDDIEQMIELETNLKLKNVSLKYLYSNSNALKDINIKVNKGEVIALVGVNGSGKTTLAKTLLQLYKPDAGIVTINGEIIPNNLNLNKLCEWKSAVFQDYCRYPLSLIDNILIGNRKKQDLHFALEILKDLGFNPEIFDFNHTLGKELGKRDLSGGQWQKVAIGRAIYKNSEFIVLDEPTAEIDPLQEKEFYDYLKRILNDKTGIIITHKLGSIRFADKIIVLDDGKIIEEGTHSELIKNNGHYARLWTTQVKNYVY